MLSKPPNVALAVKLQSLCDIANAVEGPNLSTSEDPGARQSRRRSSKAGAYIEIAALNRRLQCRVLNVSVTGACVELAAENVTDLRFCDQAFDMIVVWPVEKIQASCAVVWQQDRRIGLRFLTPLESSVQKPQ